LGRRIDTARSEADLRSLVAGVNEIWAQAGIQFDAVKVGSVEAPPDLLDQIDRAREAVFVALHAGRLLVPTLEVVTGFAAAYLPANGLSVHSLRAFVINDSTTVPPERVCAHELGHLLLGDAHPLDADRLMANGQQGTVVTESEQGTARARVSELLTE
jgi:hypothetical protein